MAESTEITISGLVKEIYDMTKAVKLTGQPDKAEAEADAYAALMEQRQPLIDSLTRFSAQSPVASGSPEWRAVKGIIDDIMALDKEHRRIMNYSQEKVKASIKGIRSGIKVNDAYNHFVKASPSGHWDSKQ
jgi:hypothetical protein